MTITETQQNYISNIKLALKHARENLKNFNKSERGIKSAKWYFNKLEISLMPDNPERFNRNFHSQVGKIYIESILYPEIEKHLKESKKCIDDPEHKEFLDYWYDCNAFRLQLEELYKQHQKDQTDTSEKYDEIEDKIKQLLFMSKKLERCMN